MPTYQYRCTNCGEELEVVQKFSDDPLEVCPACEGQLRKVFSPVGIVFKGSGFYRTDSRNGSSAADGAKKDKEPAAKKGDSGPADPAKSGASGSSSGSGSGDSGSSGSSGSSGAKKDAAKPSPASAPAATGS